VVRGCVLHVDRFGTLVTNLMADQLVEAEGRQSDAEVWVNGISVGPVRRSFAEVPVGAAVAIIGGGGFLEVAVNQGRAVDRFTPPDQVEIVVR